MKREYYQNPDIKKDLIINDITLLNPVKVNKIIKPTTIKEIEDIIINTTENFCIGGGRFSMGCQTTVTNTTHIDMRNLNKIIYFDKTKKTITVEAGTKWHEIQTILDKHNLSLKIMQTYANFTVGGSLSVNCHGRYIGLGPLILSVKEIKIATTEGLKIASPELNSELFFGSIGCYGALGIIVEVTFELDDNYCIKRTNKVLKTEDYHSFFQNKIKTNPKSVLHNGDMHPPFFNTINAVTWERTEKVITKKRIQHPKYFYGLNRFAFWLVSETTRGHFIRKYVIEKAIYMTKPIHWKNYEAGYNIYELEPKSRKKTTYLLQEYFIPVNNFNSFVEDMKNIIKRNKINIINISIRHAFKDSGSLLAWANQEVYAFVIYYKQDTDEVSKTHVEDWTRELVNCSLKHDGSYYLPYQPHASKEQFFKAYPKATELFKLKDKLDPDYRFRNSLWERYYKIEYIKNDF